MKGNEFQNLIGLCKKEIVLGFGSEFNHYPADVWTYYLNSNCIGMKTYLIIYFNNEIVDSVKMVKRFGRIKF
ncbi:hypothetical protein C1634_010455 [Chryseobacterium viscerum]|uniref:Uncharacterized protein n=1 Tax=Chryseobacterium viscerum TaxID=1037377 RepID=A0A316WJV1_9FLAO|nr:hypothetical protein C1634_010455 [Chryseobacterium viscerum]